MNKYTVLSIFVVISLVTGAVGYFVGTFIQNSQSSEEDVSYQHVSVNPDSMQAQGTNGSTPPALQQPPQGPVHPDCGAGVPVDAVYFSKIDTCIFFPEPGLTLSSYTTGSSQFGEFYTFDYPANSLRNGGSPSNNPIRSYIEYMQIRDVNDAMNANSYCQSSLCISPRFSIWNAQTFNDFSQGIQQQTITPSLQNISISGLNPNFAPGEFRYLYEDAFFTTNDGIDFTYFIGDVGEDFGKLTYFVGEINQNLVLILYYLDDVDPTNQSLIQDSLNRFDALEFYVN